VAQVGSWLYGILFLIVFCETGLVVTPFLPGDSLLFAAGTVAGAGYMNYIELVGTLLAAAILGDFVNYEIGKHIGPKIFTRETRWLNTAHLHKTQQFYEKYGAKTIVIARFVPIVRTFAPFVAGVATMHKRVFLSYNVIGALIWVFSLVSAGYFLGNIPIIRNNFSFVIYGIIIVSVMPIPIEIIRARREKKKREI
jgi:membrane-associated protein